MKTILHAFNVETDADTVLRGITTLEGLAGWWTTQVAGSAAARGVIHFTFGGDFNPDMQVIEVRDDLVVWKCVGGHEPWADNDFRFELSGSSPVSVMFRQDYARELEDIYYGTYNFLWGYYLESLRLYCETGTGKPSADH